MDATTGTIRRVWIEQGCICCKLCQDVVPDVFEVGDDVECIVKPDAGRHFAAQRDDIEQAARDCPVEVIHIEKDGA